MLDTLVTEEQRIILKENKNYQFTYTENKKVTVEITETQCGKKASRIQHLHDIQKHKDTICSLSIESVWIYDRTGIKSGSTLKLGLSLNKIKTEQWVLFFIFVFSSLIGSLVGLMEIS